MKKLKVLQINKMYDPVTGGVERVVQQIAEGLKDQVDMKVLVCQQKGKGRAERINGVPVVRASSMGILFSMPVSLTFIPKLRKMARKQDVLHLHMPFPLGDVACLLSGFKGRIVVWWHSDIVRQKKLLRLYKPIMLRMLDRADAIVVATQGHIDGSDYLGAYREKCVVVPFAVSDGFLKIVRQEDAVPEVQSEKIRFLFVGRMVYYKGCEILIQAFAKIENAELVMVGQGPLEPSLKEMAHRLGIRDRVHFYGNMSDAKIAREYRKCDVLVLPSVEKSEAFGLVQIEAMAFGNPVINTRLDSGVPYVSLDGETGFTVPPGDVEALSTAMKRLAEDAELRSRMGAAARQRVIGHFTERAMLEGVFQVYQGQEEGK